MSGNGWNHQRPSSLASAAFARVDGRCQQPIGNERDYPKKQPSERQSSEVFVRGLFGDDSFRNIDL